MNHHESLITRPRTDGDGVADIGRVGARCDFIHSRLRADELLMSRFVCRVSNQHITVANFQRRAILDFIQIIKGEHARISDILDKLGETSDGAMKTRERLVEQLAAAIDTHTRKEEAYLYPALLRHRDAHKEAGEFLSVARREHEEIARGIAELSAM